MFKKSNKDQKILELLAQKMAAEARSEAALSENARLRAQVDRLQEALVSATAPNAYNDRRAAEMDAKELAPDSKRLKREAEINAELLYRMEQPTFRDSDDMIQMLTGVTANEFMQKGSVHGNSES